MILGHKENEDGLVFGSVDEVEEIHNSLGFNVHLELHLSRFEEKRDKIGAEWNLEKTGEEKSVGSIEFLDITLADIIPTARIVQDRTDEKGSAK